MGFKAAVAKFLTRAGVGALVGYEASEYLNENKQVIEVKMPNTNNQEIQSNYNETHTILYIILGIVVLTILLVFARLFIDKRTPKKPETFQLG